MSSSITKEKDPRSDPKVIGPGIWFTIHLTARNAKDERTKKAFLDFMKSLAAKFPCDKCRTHINDYLGKNPCEPYWHSKNESGEENGMFLWSWNFHNTVNNRLNKPYMDYDTAWNQYGDNITFCTSGCGEEPHSASPSSLPSTPSSLPSTPSLPPSSLPSSSSHPPSSLPSSSRPATLPTITIYPNQGPQIPNETTKISTNLLKALNTTLFY